VLLVVVIEGAELVERDERQGALGVQFVSGLGAEGQGFGSGRGRRRALALWVVLLFLGRSVFPVGGFGEPAQTANALGELPRFHLLLLGGGIENDKRAGFRRLRVFVGGESEHGRTRDEQQGEELANSHGVFLAGGIERRFRLCMVPLRRRKIKRKAS